MAKQEPEDKPTEQPTDEAGAPKSGSKNRVVIIAAILLLLAAAGGAGLYFSGMLGKKPDVAADGKTQPEEAPKEEASKEEGGGHGKGKPGEKGAAGTATTTKPGGPIYFSFPDGYKFIVNLNTAGKQNSFLKVDVSLELGGPSDLEAVNGNLPRIVDAFNTYLREIRPSDLQGSAGVYRLRDELLLRVNKAVYPAKVNDILFKEIIVQ